MNGEEKTEKKKIRISTFTICKTRKCPQKAHTEEPVADMNFQPLAFLLRFNILIGPAKVSSLKSRDWKHY